MNAIETSGRLLKILVTLYFPESLLIVALIIEPTGVFATIKFLADYTIVVFKIENRFVWMLTPFLCVSLIFGVIEIVRRNFLAKHGVTITFDSSLRAWSRRLIILVTIFAIGLKHSLSFEAGGRQLMPDRFDLFFEFAMSWAFSIVIVESFGWAFRRNDN